MERQDGNFPNGKDKKSRRIRRRWYIFAGVAVLLAMSAATYWVHTSLARHRIRLLLYELGQHNSDRFDLSGLDESAIPHLLAILQDAGEEKLRGSVPTVFARMGPTATKAVPDLIQLLTHSDPDTRYLAAVSLGGIDPPPIDAIHHLIPLLGDVENGKATWRWRSFPTTDRNAWCSSVSFAAAFAISNIGSPAVPATIQALKHENAHIRVAAARALGMMGLDEKPVVGALLAVALKDKDSWVRTWAIDALGLIKTVDESAISGLIEALKDTNAGVRSRAADALGNIGPAAKASVPSLIRMLKDDQPGLSGQIRLVVSDHVSWALASIGEAAVPSLMEALKDESEQVRKRAAETLEKIRQSE